MASFTSVLSDVKNRLENKGYALKETGVQVSFATPCFDTPILAVPDVHLCDGGGGDIFLERDPNRAQKLASVLEVIGEYMDAQPLSCYAVQLGDWFDIWRISGGDPAQMTYGKIQNAAAYQRILQLDADLGLAHVIGNHDAGFLKSLPDRRAGQESLFRLGFWLGKNVYALHGHQHDLAPPEGSTWDETVVHVATVIGGLAPGVTHLQEYIDRLGTSGIGKWLRDTFLGVRQDPPMPHRPPDNGKAPPNVRSGSFVVRENMDALASIVDKIGSLPASHGRAADVVLVGHSHQPCAAWTEVTGRPIVVVDAGCWVYGQANLLVAAGDTIAVYDVA
jgi:hypothetical protein